MSHAAEQAVLGSIMLDAAAYHRVAGLIDGRDFAAPEHRHLWELLSELIRDGSPIDAVTVGEIAERKGLSGKVGGSAYIVELADGTPGAAPQRRTVDCPRPCDQAPCAGGRKAPCRDGRHRRRCARRGPALDRPDPDPRVCGVGEHPRCAQGRLPAHGGALQRRCAAGDAYAVGRCEPDVGRRPWR
ncbi:MAG: hypothetical protein IPK53_11005, partial [bacterium]|nr:hypothetical protein [bacterium]